MINLWRKFMVWGGFRSDCCYAPVLIWDLHNHFCEACDERCFVGATLTEEQIVSLFRTAQEKLKKNDIGWDAYYHNLINQAFENLSRQNYGPPFLPSYCMPPIHRSDCKHSFDGIEIPIRKSSLTAEAVMAGFTEEKLK